MILDRDYDENGINDFLEEIQVHGMVVGEVGQGGEVDPRESVN